MPEFVLSIPSMSCRHCARAVSAVVRDVPGVRIVAANIRTATVTICGEASAETVRAVLQAAGYETDD